MKSIIAVVLFCLFTATAFAADEIYEQEGIGFAESQNKACEEALLYAKHEALDSAGTIVRSTVQSTSEVNGKQVSKAASIDIRQLSNGLVKVISKETEVFKKDGGISCHVKAKLSIDTASVLKHNKTYEGQVPEWAVSPPRILGKITVVDSDKTLDGAIAKALVKYVENSLAPNAKLNAIQSKVSSGDSVISSAGNVSMMNKCYTDEGKSVVICEEVYKGIFDAQINTNITLKWMNKKYAQERDGLIDESVETAVSRVIFKNGQNEREFGSFHEVKKGSSLEEPKAEDGSTVYKESATIDMVIADLRNSGFIVEYELINAEATKEWFVMLINKKNTNNFSTKSKSQ